MRAPLAAFAAFSLLSAAGTAFAGTVYVPVPDPVGSLGTSHVVQVWISNSGTVQRPYSGTFLEAEKDGTKRSGKPTDVPVPAGRTSLLGGIGFLGKVGLLEIEANPAMSIEARMLSTPSNGPATSSAVPVISSDNLLAAGKTAVLQGLLRDDLRGDVSNLGIVNLAKQAAQCEVKAFRADGTQILATISLTFLPLSLRHFPDTFGILRELRVADARLQITCNQPFYAFATVVNPGNGQMTFVTPSASGASTLTGPGGGDPTTPPPATGATVFTLAGLFHTATTALPKGAFDVTLPKDLSLKRLVIDVDFTPSAWNLSKSPNNHGVIWLYRGKFRGDTIANVNAFGPSKMTLKASQNINLGPRESTQQEAGVAWQLGKKYHLRYTYDAENSKVSVVLSLAGATVKSFEYPTTAPNRVLDVPAHGMKVEFGHYPGQEGPEVPSYGWRYSDLKIEMFPY